MIGDPLVVVEGVHWWRNRSSGEILKFLMKRICSTEDKGSQYQVWLPRQVVIVAMSSEVVHDLENLISYLGTEMRSRTSRAA